MLGTVVNTVAIVGGSALGLVIHSRMPRRIVDVVFQAMGLVTIAIGITMSLETKNILLVVVSLVVGAAVGEIVGIDRGIGRLSARLQPGKPSGDATVADDASRHGRFSEGFITAVMLFGVGSMSILGAMEDGMGEMPVLLYTKSIMDFISSIILAASFGIGVMFSAIPILIYQGAITLFAAFMMRYMSDVMIADMTGVGGVLLIGLGLTILKIKEINISNMLPALIIVVILSWFFG